MAKHDKRRSAKPAGSVRGAKKVRRRAFSLSRDARPSLSRGARTLRPRHARARTRVCAHARTLAQRRARVTSPLMRSRSLRDPPQKKPAVMANLERARNGGVILRVSCAHAHARTPTLRAAQPRTRSARAPVVATHRVPNLRARARVGAPGVALEKTCAHARSRAPRAPSPAPLSTDPDQ
jgi:hypothetical protein